jgi:pyruvate dehydrogenase E2 component (dihydrolipoamide acetyltransferase)
MPINITMPALSPTMEEGNLAKWLVKEGDEVKAGDVIAEIETDKATMEVEAVDEGKVAKIVVPAGTEGVKVNALIAVLAEEGEDVKDAAKAAGDGAKSKAEAEKPPVSSPGTGEVSAKRTEGVAAESPSSPAGPSPRKNGEKEDGRSADAPSPRPYGERVRVRGSADRTHFGRNSSVRIHHLRRPRRQGQRRAQGQPRARLRLARRAPRPSRHRHRRHP